MVVKFYLASFFVQPRPILNHTSKLSSPILRNVTFPYFGKTVVTISISCGRVICPEHLVKIQIMFSKRKPMLQLQTFWKINPEAVPQVHDVQVSELIALRKTLI